MTLPSGFALAPFTGSLRALPAPRRAFRGSDARGNPQVLAQVFARVPVNRQTGIRLIAPNRLLGTPAHRAVNGTGPVSQLGEHALDIRDQLLE